MEARARGWLDEAVAVRFEGLDVVSPTIDYLALAQALGVPACRATEPDEISELVSRSLAGDTPQLIEVVLQQPDG
jgi:thiamine pyrophosphate-dependent acetolactate synthase large subunit-like protein